MRRGIFLALALLGLSVRLSALMTRVREAARPLGQRENQLSGLGLVVGLNGTGDTQQTLMTQQALGNLLSNNGLSPDTGLKSRNVALVMVTAELKPLMRSGDKLDVLVSSIGDSSSLSGGTLLQVPLKGADGKVYAVAQGAISLGEQMGGRVGSLISSRGFKAAGRVPGGALVENEVPSTLLENGNIEYVLRNPDPSSAARMAIAINERLREYLRPAADGEVWAEAKDAKTVLVKLPYDLQKNPVEFMAVIDQVEFNLEEGSGRVVVNERTGTVVIGYKVSISSCGVAHGNLNVNVRVTSQVSQPVWFSPGSSALYFNNQNINVKGGGGSLVALPETATVQDLVRALNAIGASPRDLIAILQAIKEAGALHGELEIL